MFVGATFASARQEGAAAAGPSATVRPAAAAPTGAGWIGGPVPRNTPIPAWPELLARGARMLWLQAGGAGQEPVKTSWSDAHWDYRHRLLAPIKVSDGWSPDRTDCLCTVVMNVEPEREEEFNEWYDTEHTEYIGNVPGVVSASRFRFVDGEPRYIAIYQVTGPEILMSPEYASATETPWTFRVRRSMRDVSRIVYRRMS